MSCVACLMLFEQVHVGEEPDNEGVNEAMIELTLQGKKPSLCQQHQLARGAIVGGKRMAHLNKTGGGQKL